MKNKFLIIVVFMLLLNTLFANEIKKLIVNKDSIQDSFATSRENKYKFSAEKGGYYLIEVQALDECDPVILLYDSPDSNREALSHNDDIFNKAGEKGAKIEWLCPSDDDYYISCQPYQNQIGNYNISIKKDFTVGEPETIIFSPESNNIKLEKKFFNHSYGWFKLNTDINNRYFIETIDQGKIDTDLKVYDKDYKLVDFSNSKNNNSGGKIFFSSINATEKNFRNSDNKEEYYILIKNIISNNQGNYLLNCGNTNIDGTVINVDPDLQDAYNIFRTTKYAKKFEKKFSDNLILEDPPAVYFDTIANDNKNDIEVYAFYENLYKYDYVLQGDGVWVEVSEKIGYYINHIEINIPDLDLSIEQKTILTAVGAGIATDLLSNKNLYLAEEAHSVKIINLLNDNRKLRGPNYSKGVEAGFRVAFELHNKKLSQYGDWIYAIMFSCPFRYVNNKKEPLYVATFYAIDYINKEDNIICEWDEQSDTFKTIFYCVGKYTDRFINSLIPGYIHWHHLLPVQYKDIFEPLGFHIDFCRIPMLPGEHNQTENGIHTGPFEESWNGVWDKFFKETQNPSMDDVLNQLAKMIRDFKLMDKF